MLSRVRSIVEDGEGLVEEMMRRGAYLPRPRFVAPEGFVDLSIGLRCGIYALVLSQRIVFLGSTDRPLEMIAAHRDRREHPSWLPFQAIEFDQVWVKPSNPDRIASELEELIQIHKPIYNSKVIKSQRLRHEVAT